MPDFSCKVNDIGSATNCSDKAGLLVVFAAQDSSIDWASMADAANYTDATYTIIQWAMNGGGTWHRFNFERKNGRLDATYTSDNGFYDAQLNNLLFKGKSATRTISFGQLIACCGLTLQIHDNNGLARVMGKEFVSGAWVDPLEKAKVTRHFDTTGAFGNADDKNRDEVDFGAEHSNPLPYSAVTISAMDLI